MPPGRWTCRDTEGFLIRGWELILPGCGGTSALARGATLAARGRHEPHRISCQPERLGFPNTARQDRPGQSPFSSLGCWSCRYLEGFLIRDFFFGNLSSLGPAGPRRWPEWQLSSSAGPMSPSQSVITPWGWVSTPCGVVSTRGIYVFVPGLLRVVEIRKDF